MQLALRRPLRLAAKIPGGQAESGAQAHALLPIRDELAFGKVLEKYGDEV